MVSFPDSVSIDNDMINRLSLPIPPDVGLDGSCAFVPLYKDIGTSTCYNVTNPANSAVTASSFRTILWPNELIFPLTPLHCVCEAKVFSDKLKIGLREQTNESRYGWFSNEQDNYEGGQ